MRIVVWITPATWRACVDAARERLGAATEATDVLLLHVDDEDATGTARGAFAGLLGRGLDGPASFEDEMTRTASGAADDLLADAASRLGVPARADARRGRAEHEVVSACEGADLLVLGRDGDRHALGPKSLGHASRFVLDHAPCAVLLVWPEQPPSLASMPPRPPHHEHHHRHGHHPHKG
jgi:nucleotide-binding universal stress UspA family protein